MNRSTRSRIVRLLVLPAVLLLISPMVSAKGEKTGVLEGVVTDDRDVPIPGVTVTVSGPALDGTRSTVTDGDGRYRIENLPAADSYEIYFALGGDNTTPSTRAEYSAGFTTALSTGVSVKRGAAAAVDARLLPLSCDHQIEDRFGYPPLIPGGSSMITEVFTWRFLDTLPNGRSWLDAVSMMPGVAGLEEPYHRGSSFLFMDGADITSFHVHGADIPDNIYLVDGVETTNAATGRTGMALPWEAIEEVEVHTGGLPAEYGRATGGVVNVVTRQGGNQFHGSLPVYYTDDGLQQGQDEGRGFINPNEYHEWEWGGSLGGPVVRDHLWFFAAYNRFTRTMEYLNYDYEPVERDDIYQEGLANLVWQLNPDNKLKIQYAHSPTEWPYDDSPSIDVPAVQRTGDELFDLEWTGILNPDLFIEARVAHHEAYTEIASRYSDDYEPRFIDEMDGMGRVVSGNVASIRRTNAPRTQYQASLNWYRGDWAGDHKFKFGAEYQDLEYGEEQIIPDTYTLNRPYDQPDVWLVRNEVDWVDSGSILTLFAQDDWTWRDDWAFNIGLRWEQQEQVNDVGERVYQFDSLLSPRLGVSWDVRGDGRSRLFAHYGRYHDAMGLYLARFLNRQVVDIRRGEGDYETGDWTFIEPTYGPENYNTADEGLEPNYKDEVVVGYEFEFLGDFAAAARLIVNRQSNMIEDVLLNEDEIREGAETEYIYLITNVDSARRDYRGLELSLKKQLSHNYQFLAVCTLSESRGSVAYNDYAAEGLSVYADFEEMKHNRYGKLPWDDQQYLKLNGSYHLPLGFIVGASLNWRSGRPYSRIDPRLPETAGYIAGYTGQYYLDPRGSNRLGSAWWLDLRLRKDFAIGPTTLSLTADAFNLTNNQHVIGRSELYTYYYEEPTAWMRAGYFVLGGKLAF